MNRYISDVWEFFNWSMICCFALLDPHGSRGALPSSPLSSSSEGLVGSLFPTWARLVAVAVAVAIAVAVTVLWRGVNLEVSDYVLPSRELTMTLFWLGRFIEDVLAALRGVDSR